MLFVNRKYHTLGVTDTECRRPTLLERLKNWWNDIVIDDPGPAPAECDCPLCGFTGWTPSQKDEFGDLKCDFCNCDLMTCKCLGDG